MSQFDVGKIDREKQEDEDDVNVAAYRTVQIPRNARCGSENMLFANDDVVLISWQYSADERVPSLRHTNEVMGAYVNAGARIHLYGFLDKLQEKAINTETDCAIFIQPGPKSEPTLIKTGDNLGQMQSELEQNEIIVEVDCAGPKNYAYKTKRRRLVR